MDQPPIPQYPVPYTPPKSGVPSWVWIVLAVGCGGILLIVLFLAAILFPVFAQARESARTSSCLSNEKRAALGILMYAQDYDENFPPSTKWMDVTVPYVKDESIFYCPSVGTPKTGPYGYAMNSDMSGKYLGKITTPAAELLIYDSSTGTRNATDLRTSLPNPKRHRTGNVVGFADGHVRLFRGDTYL